MKLYHDDWTILMKLSPFYFRKNIVSWWDSNPRTLRDQILGLTALTTCIPWTSGHTAIKFCFIIYAARYVAITFFNNFPIMKLFWK